ncbi:MAG: hypothetical protein JXA69_17940 [Phycisphaerae bacterium]|nr:hypothetical protein [Phycisphaerae bacterium]
MNHDDARYAFLSWLRRGVSTEITRIDGDATPAARAEIPIRLSFDVGTGIRNAQVNLALHGPGDVAGIDPRLIIRTYPRPDVFDAEPNYFPAIEFDQPDFPWRYTPARANAGQPGRAPASPGEGARLRPWLVLIALADDEVEAFEPAGTDGRLPTVTVKTADSLPDLSQSWAWAHVQVASLRDGESVSDILDKEPRRILSRLLCPRRLMPRTAYTAYLVPSLERGRRAGLNEPVDEDPNQPLDALTPAWSDGDTAIRLPVYYQWRFQTGVVGDFEYLVRQLRARSVPDSVGRRDMDGRAPGAGLPEVSSTPLGLEGALMSPKRRGVADDWDPQERNCFVGALRDLVNLPAVRLEQQEGDHLVVPPLYGRWYAAQERLRDAGQPPWFHELNADPRLRTAAGLGTQVVQHQQEQLMASAWAQVAGILEINQRMRLAQLARETAARVRTRHLAAFDAETLLLVTGPLLGRISASPRTVQAMLKHSPVAEGVFDGQFRRIARPLGPIGRRQGRPAKLKETTLLSRMNLGKLGELSSTLPPPTPSGMATPSRTGADLVPPSVLNRLLVLPMDLRVLALIAFALAVVFFPASVAASAILGLIGLASGAGALIARRIYRGVRLRAGLRDGTLTAEDIRQAPAAQGFVPAEAPPGSHTPQLSPEAVSTRADARRAVADLRTALGDLFSQINAPPAAAATFVPAALPQLHAKVMAATDPGTAIVQPIRSRLRIAPGATWQPQDPLEPPMAAPTFEQPMYEPLRDLSQEWLLPGVGAIPANTTTLLVTNRQFVESYMAGLNHEMARELLWREYPTDQRGTYFRQFWDVRGHIAPSGMTQDPETLKDIAPMHTWRDRLGTHRRATPPGGEHLVLLIRGDVLRRYPNTIVYANKAERGVAGLRGLSEALDAKRYPIFQGSLKPDVSFFGFDLTPEEVRGSTDPDADQGWFFVLQEQPTEPRFGLDIAEPHHYGRPVASWEELSWGHLVSDREVLDSLAYIDLNADLPDTRNVVETDAPDVAWHAERGLGAAGTRASDLAYITLQQPFRVAKHGSDMLPPPEGN